jgi:hypothetical protein
MTVAAALDMIRAHTARRLARDAAAVAADDDPGTRILGAIFAEGEEYAVRPEVLRMLDRAAAHDPAAVEAAAARAIADYGDGDCESEFAHLVRAELIELGVTERI